MRRVNDDDVFAELVARNPVDEEALGGVADDPGFGALPSLIVEQERKAAEVEDRRARPSRLPVPTSIGARAGFVGAVACCALLIGLFGRVGDDEVAIEPAADNGATEAPAPAAEALGDSAAVDDGEVGPPEPSAAASTTTVVVAGGDRAAQGTEAESTATQSPPTPDRVPSTGSEATTDTTAAPACTAEGATLTEAIVAYREECSRPRVDCDPITPELWRCSSEIIGTRGPTSSIG